MHSQALVFATLFSLAFGQPTSSTQQQQQRFRLRTELKNNTSGGYKFSNLYLSSYHTGAGESDAVLTANQTAGHIASLSGTTGHYQNTTYQNLVLNLGTQTPWTMDMNPEEVKEAFWQSVQINGEGIAAPPKNQSGFEITSTGLQWSSSPSTKPSDNLFDGWLVCDWWHAVPQLFFRIKLGDSAGKVDVPPAPAGCADVNLVPENA